MSDIEFTAWPKIARLNRTITITEKIDGTNAAIGIADRSLSDGELSQGGWDDWAPLPGDPNRTVRIGERERYTVYAQSRKALITRDRDNFGFAAWVWDNAFELAALLGPGLHFGEWWGSGIQRGYGLPKGEKRFSLFNTKRWYGLASLEPDRLWMREDGYSIAVPPALGVVPVLYEGPFDAGLGHGTLRWAMRPWESALDYLATYGSQASPGFMDPEGIVIYHHAANSMFKVTLKNDEAPKGSLEAR